MSASSNRLPGLDTLRATAIVAVISYHAAYLLPDSWYAVTQFGWMGVDLFFVLSGFLIGSQILREHDQTGGIATAAFYQRRAFRILPTYFVVLALYLALPQIREQSGVAPWWKFVTFTENLLFRPEQRTFSHVWSLCVEEHFYLVLPLLVTVMMRRPSARRTVLLVSAIVLAGIALRGWTMHQDVDFYRRIYYPTYMRLDGLVLGVVLAAIRTFRRAWWDRIGEHGHTTLLTGAGLVGSVMLLFCRDQMAERTGPGAWGMIFGLPVMAMGFSLIVASAVSRNGFLSRQPIPGAKPLALLAFSLYLSHKAVLHFVHTKLFPRLTAASDLRSTLIYAASCLAVATLLYLCVERPFLLIRDRLASKSVPSTTDQMQQEPAI